MRVIIVPGMGCTPIGKCNWYAWLAKELRDLGHECILRDFPDPHKCRESVWVPFVRDELGLDESTVLVGHSSGAACVMRILERDDWPRPALGAILVAAAYTDLDDPDERASQYFNRPWQWERLKNSTKQGIVLFHGTDDELIPVSEARFIATRLACENFSYCEMDGKSHFFGPWPEILGVFQSKFHGGGC